METARVVAVVAVGAGALACWLVPGFNPALGALALALGGAALWSFWRDPYGPVMTLALGEAFAVAIGLAAPVLAVLAQPVIAAFAVGARDRQGLVLASVAATLAAAAVLLFSHTLLPLLALVAGGAVAVTALAGVEGWLRRRYAGAPA